MMWHLRTQLMGTVTTGQQLDKTILIVFSNLNDSVVLKGLDVIHFLALPNYLLT